MYAPRRGAPDASAQTHALGDFTADRRLLMLVAMALVVGAGGALGAWALLKLIALASNLIWLGKASAATMSFSAVRPSAWMVAAPAIGGLVIGLMARFGSEKIRGHGIPEAIEAILIGGSRMSAKVAVLKPLSSAVAIGSGGPFGAEGPIIMTGGALGSLFAQLFHLSAAERKTLLVAGAAAGMTGVFGTPVAAVLLAVELLLFEWKPRSFLPVVAAVIVSIACRPFLIGSGPLFPATFSPDLTTWGLLLCVGVGLVAGLQSSLLTVLLYAAEDLFPRLKLHWMWWPAIGGVGIGLGGIFFPHGLGVGYDNIAVLLSGKATLGLLLGLIFAKSLMWAFSLGSGTSGGVLAPLLMIGGALGEIAAHYAHATAEQQALWAAVGMGAMLSGSLGVPLTAAVFCLEITRSLPAALPVLLGCIAAYTITSLIMPRSILTEKIGRRGTHLTREYGTDPLETVSLREVMLEVGDECVCEEDGVTATSETDVPDVYAYADETSRSAVEKMATLTLNELAVVDRASGKVCGTVTLQDLLLGRRRAVHRERKRERVFARHHGEV
jgi:H+/Cl- antiporter ClcA